MIPTGAEDRPGIIHGHRSQSRRGQDEENRLLYAAGFEQIRGGLWKKERGLVHPRGGFGEAAQAQQALNRRIVRWLRS